MQFTKPATSFDEQIQLLQSRGMEIPDTAMAKHYLSHLNYYRIGAYWLQYESDHATHTFKPGTRFDDVIKLYVFDRELRLLVMDAIERIEVSVRTHLAYVLAHTYGAHAYLDKSIFKAKNYDVCMEKLKGILGTVYPLHIAQDQLSILSPESPEKLIRSL